MITYALIFFTFLTFALTGITVWFLFKHAQSTDSKKAEDYTLSKAEMRKFHYLKAFYVNPDDPRGVVPKTFGIGWTVNFRTKNNARIFAILIVLTLASAITITFLAL